MYVNVVTKYTTTCVTGKNYEVTRSKEWELVVLFQTHPNCVINIGWGIAAAIIENGLA